jgi:NAD(P)H-dependent FMN reductase
MKKFIAIVGTNSKHSTNRKLLQFMQKRYASSAEIELVEIAGLPIYKKSEKMEILDQVQVMADKINEADGVIIGTPEYDHSVPAVLLSALAWLSYGIHPLLDKPVMITGASYGALGASRAQAQLRQILDSPELKARVMPSSEFLLANSLKAFDEAGNLVDREKVEHLDGLFKDFLLFTEISQQLNHANAVNREEMENFSWDEGSGIREEEK